MLFGVPVLLSVNMKDKAAYTLETLQREVWRRVKRYIEVRAEEKGAPLDLDAMDSAPPFSLVTVSSPLGTPLSRHTLTQLMCASPRCVHLVRQASVSRLPVGAAPKQLQVQRPRRARRGLP